MNTIDLTTADLLPRSAALPPRGALIRELTAVLAEALTPDAQELRCSGVEWEGADWEQSLYGWELSSPEVRGLYPLTACPDAATLRLATEELARRCSAAGVTFIVEAA